MAGKKYQVELPDGSKYEIEEPNQPTLTQRVAASEPVQTIKDVIHGVSEGHGGQMLKDALDPGMIASNVGRFGKRLASNIFSGAGAGPIGMIRDIPALLDKAKADAERVKEKGFFGALKENVTPSAEGAVQLATGVDPSGGSPERGADLATQYLFMRGLGLTKKPGAPKPAGGGPRVPPVTETAMAGPKEVPPARPGVFFGGVPSTTAPKASAILPSTESTQSIRGRVSKGVTNDFKARVSIAKGAYPSNVQTAERTADLMDRVVSGGAKVDHKLPLGPEDRRGMGRVPEARLEAEAEQLRAGEGGDLTPEGGGTSTPTGTQKIATPDTAAAIEKAVAEERAGDAAHPEGGRFKLPKAVVSDEAFEKARGRELERNRPDVVPDLLKQPQTPPKIMGMGQTPAPELPASWEGFTPGKKTQSLAAMAAEHGPEEAAARAGMTVDELNARIEAGNDPAKLAKLLRERLGAEKAARALGMSPEEVRKMSGGGPSKLPARAVEQIKATAEKERAATGSVSPKTQALLDRIKSEGGASPAKVMAMMGAPVLGAVGGSLLPSNNEDETIANTLMGGGAGLLAAGGMAVPRAWWQGAGQKALAARREGFLTGGAIPKNVMTDFVGAPLRTAFENTGTSRFGPAKELLMSPRKNAQTFWNSLTQQPISHYAGQYHLPGKLSRLQPSKWIGAIDDTARAALKRGGVSPENIDRYLLQKDYNIFKPKMMDKATGKQVDVLGPEARSAVDIAYPFQRIPSNVFMEGFNEVGHTAKKLLTGSVDGRAALNIAQTLGFGALGAWAGNDPKKRYLVSILLAASGPNALASTVAASTGAGASGFAAGALGGISPIPEQGLDPKSILGAKPAFLTLLDRLR